LTLKFNPRSDRTIRVVSPGYGIREFAWTEDIPPGPAGDFGNYIKAAAQSFGKRWGIGCGFDAAVSSNIPAAAGLSSSSALVIAATLALFRMRELPWNFPELMKILPEGEMYVGTRGGAMDHAVCLAGRQGCAVRIAFDPITVVAEPIPPGWVFFIAHSLQRAEKSGAAKEAYNHRRSLAQAGDPSALRHALSERDRVTAAVAAMQAASLETFGALLNASHRSLRDDLQVSCERADRLVDACLAAGAAGARIMGAGFGGYVVALCEEQRAGEVLERLDRDHFAHLPERAQFLNYLMRVEACEGALGAQ
jgi:galactokinase